MPNNSHYDINVTHNIDLKTVAIEITSVGVIDVKEFQQIKRKIFAVFEMDPKILLNDNKSLKLEIPEKLLLNPNVRTGFDNIMLWLLEENKLHFNDRSIVNGHLNAIASNHMDDEISKYKMEL